MAPSRLGLLALLLAVSTVLAAPHLHRKYYHNHKHPFDAGNATDVVGPTGAGMNIILPISSVVVVPVQVPEIALTVSPVPASSGLWLWNPPLTISPPLQ